MTYKVTKEMINTLLSLKSKDLAYRMDLKAWTDKEKKAWNTFHDITTKICDDDTIECKDFRCDYCPYSDVCDKHELFYGCAVWEDEMGNDL